MQDRMIELCGTSGFGAKAKLLCYMYVGELQWAIASAHDAAEVLQSLDSKQEDPCKRRCPLQADNT
eukprot:224698-Amphidinium_carterae.2